MKNWKCPDRFRTFVRYGVIAIVMFISFALICPQAVQAEYFLDELVGSTGELFFIEHNLPGLVIGAVRNSEISIQGFGKVVDACDDKCDKCDNKCKEPDGDTIIRIGSITKAFNGEVLAHLVARNAVQFTDPITKTVPEIAANAKADLGRIRLIDLATHSGGLLREVPRKPGQEKEPMTIHDFTNWLNKEPLLFKPGKAVHYSNFGFDLLALGLSRAAKEPFSLLVQRYITDPLNMKDTVFVLSEEQKKRFMRGHGIDGKIMEEIPAGSTVTGGAGGLYSTPRDLLKWMQWHLDSFNQTGAEARQLDHAVYLMRDGLTTVSGVEKMDA
ncbi:MAG: serine hydrolase, partial [Smithella sp.]